MSDDVSYDPSYFAPIAEAEDRHFWFKARRTILKRLLQQLKEQAPAGARVLEVGCGTGNVTKVLVDVFGAAAVTAMEPWENAVRIAQRRLPCKVIVGDLAAPSVEGPFAIVGMFDVLEHLPDERASLDAAFELVAPGGCLVLTVPAHQSLWSYFDEEAGHFRRYEREGLRAALERSGFRVEYVSELFPLLFPMMWLGRRVSKLRGDKQPDKEKVLGELRTVPVVNEVLTWVLSREAAWVARRRETRLGTSIVAVARR